MTTGSQNHDNRGQQYFYAVFCLRNEVPRDNDDVCTKILLPRTHSTEDSGQGHDYPHEPVDQRDLGLTPGFIN